MAIKTADCKQAIVDKILASNGISVLAMAYSGTYDVTEFLKNVYLYNPKTLDTIQNPTVWDVLTYAGDVKYWKRESKERVHRAGEYGADYGSKVKPAIYFRSFDCQPFEDQLRAYTWDDGNKILQVDIVGE